MIIVTFIDKYEGDTWTATYTAEEFEAVKAMVENDPAVAVCKVEVR